MTMKLIRILIAVAMFSLVPLSSATYSIDISGLKSEDYSLGGDLIFKVVLLEDSKLVDGTVDIKLADALNQKEIIRQVPANQDATITIEEDFRSGIWEISASYVDAKIVRTFTIGENSEVEFIIEGDELIIRNKGNVRYTRTVRLKIGDSVHSYVQNIGVGEEKRLKLLSPEGFYDIEVTDGKTSIKRGDIQLFGTGNVVGAVDVDLAGYTGFAGTNDPSKIKEGDVSLSKLPISLVFIGAIAALGILVLIERKMTKGRKK